MASVSPSGNGFRVQWREGGGRTDPKQSERFRTEASAYRFRDMVNTAGQRWPEGWVRGHGFAGQTIAGAPVRGADARGSQSVAEWCAYFYRDDNRELAANPGTRAGYRGTLAVNLAGTPFGDAPLFEATREGFQAWVDSVGARLAYSTTETLRNIVGPALRAAHRMGIIASDPTVKVGIPGEKIKRAFFASEAQIAALIEATPEGDRLAVRTLAETGLRYIELEHLAPEDVHYSPATGVYWLMVNRSKTRNGIRKVTLGTKLGIELTALAERRRGEARLFDLPNHESGFHSRSWRHARKRVGLPRMRIHDLRHSHASWLLANGATLFVVSKRLGHGRLAITSDLYGHLSHEDAGLVGILDRI